MKVNISLLDIGKLKEINFSRKYDINEVPFKIENLKFKEDFNISFVVKKISKLYMVNGKYDTVYRMTCDKCGSEFDFDIDKAFEFFLTKETDENDDMSVIEIGNRDVIDLTEYVREELILGLPVTVKCNENCKGMCPVCGINLNKEKCDCDKDEPGNIFANIDLNNFDNVGKDK